MPGITASMVTDRGDHPVDQARERTAERQAQFQKNYEMIIHRAWPLRPPRYERLHRNSWSYLRCSICGAASEICIAFVMSFRRAMISVAHSAHTLRSPLATMTEKPERRDPVRRAAFVQSVVTHIIQGPLSEFTVETLQHLLNTSPEIADRILHRLSSVGLLQEKRHGVWVRVTPTTPSPVII
jgi:hypothetical protein